VLNDASALVRSFDAAVRGDTARVQRELQNVVWIDTSRWPEGLASAFIRSDGELHEALAARLRENPSLPMRDRATEFRPALERLGHVRPDSQPSTAERRLREILAKHVVGALVSEDELSVQSRAGRKAANDRRR
jgi:hypothetical protein